MTEPNYKELSKELYEILKELRDVINLFEVPPVLDSKVDKIDNLLQKYKEAIQNLNNIKERRTQKLKEMGNQPLDVIVIGGVKYRRVVEEPTPKPPTLYEKLELPYSTVGYMFNEGQKEWICKTVGEWLSYYGDYLQGYNDLLEHLKADLK
jgi:hypothetical protein